MYMYILKMPTTMFYLSFRAHYVHVHVRLIMHTVSVTSNDITSSVRYTDQLLVSGRPSQSAMLSSPSSSAVLLQHSARRPLPHCLDSTVEEPLSARQLSGRHDWPLSL